MFNVVNFYQFFSYMVSGLFHLEKNLSQFKIIKIFTSFFLHFYGFILYISILDPSGTYLRNDKDVKPVPNR